jgi:flavin prenyltransferase
MSPEQRAPKVFVGITGASGHWYAERLIQELVRAGAQVSTALTPAAAKVLRHERGIDAGAAGELLPLVLERWLGAQTAAGVRAYRPDAVEAPPSSGTSLTGGVVICPCSMGSLARISVGFSSNLVERAADVALKERRRLVLVPRETPLSEIHLENLLRMARLGAHILPAMPGFYHNPKSIDDLVGHVVGKVLDLLGFEHRVGARWQGLPEVQAEPGIDPAKSE